MRFTASLFFVGLASVASAQPVNFTLSTTQTSPISPYIYGINGTSLGNYNNPTFERTGGNRITAYNWTNNYSNAGSDYLYENDNYYTSSTAAGAGMALAITPALNSNAGIVVGVPIQGYVSKDDLGGNADVRYYPGTTTFDPNWLTDRFDVAMPSKSLAGAGAFTLTPSPSSSVVYEDEFVNWVKSQYPAGFTKNTTTPIWFELDNEPDLWTSTHPEIRPIVPGSVSASNPEGIAQPLTYAELVSRSVAYASAIKAVAPNAKVLGPVSYGWEGYTSLQAAPDSGTDGDFLTYYLNQMAAASRTAGTRLVDGIDLHWYSEVTATSSNILITNADSGYSGSTLTALMAARVQAPRSLWDPTYVENSWITADSTNGQPIQLLPREKAKIAATSATYGSQYTANQISISEYNYGGGDDISGGIAEADALGIFGQQGVLSANEWQLNSNESFIGGAFQMYRNYDGHGSTFGDISLGSTSSSNSAASIYASEYSTNSARMTFVAINKTTGNLTADLPLPNAPDGKAFTEAAVYDLTSSSSTPTFVENIAIANPAAFSYTMPGYSVTTIAISAAAPPTWTTAISGSWSATGNWTGGVPDGIGTIAVINASTATALTVTLDKPQTLGALLFGNSASATASYTLSGAGTNSLTFNNSGYGAMITVTGGTHAINAPVILADNLQVSGGSTAWTLSFGTSSIISGAHSLTMSGNGTVVLAGQNTFTGGVTLAAGVVNLGAAENGTAGPLGETGSIVFNGGTLQYSASNQHDYSNRFGTAANQAYSVDTNGQNVTWATALTSSGNDLTKAGNGMLTLTSTGNNLVAANVNGGGITVSGGSVGAFNLNTGAGTTTIGAGTTVTSINLNAGGVTVSGGTIGAFNLNTAAGTLSIAPAATVASFNVNVGGVSLSGSTIGTFNHNTGAVMSTIGSSETVAQINVNAGTLNFNSTKANGTLTLPAGSTGMVVVGSASGGFLPTVAVADFSNTPSTGTVNAVHPLAITSTLKLPNGTSATLSNGSSFTAASANLANVSTPSTLGVSGTLKFAIPSTPQSIAVHWSDYGGSDYSGITGSDGVVAQNNWTNVSANWYSGGASSLINNSGSATTAAVTCTLPATKGTYWSALGPTTGVNNLLCGPGGGNGGTGGTTAAIPNVITGIPYSSYEIIGYVNSYESASGDYSVWLDSKPSSGSPTNAPASGSRYYYSPTFTNPDGYVQITDNSNASTYNAGNTVVWTGLTGSSQTLWTEGWRPTGANDGNVNEGFTGFQIINTATTSTTINLPATAVSASSSSTLDFGETAAPSQYHTLGLLSLTAGTAGGTRLQLQNGLNVDFNGLSATYPTSGTGAMTASIVAGSTSPVISLASSSSVNVGQNVTLAISLKVGNRQAGATALTKTGLGTLILSGSDSYSGGTQVNSGTLVLNGAASLLTGSKLTIGSGVGPGAVFALPVVTQSVPAATLAPVPEPGTLVMLTIAAIAGLGLWRRRSLRKSH